MKHFILCLKNLNTLEHPQKEYLVLRKILCYLIFGVSYVYHFSILVIENGNDGSRKNMKIVY